MESLVRFVRDNHDREWFCLTVIIVFSYISFALPLQLLGLPAGYDMLKDIRFALTIQDALSAGQLFPSWANDNFGFGSVGIRFFPLLSYYALAVTHLITHDWFAAFVANLYLWMVVGSVGIYLFVKDSGTPLLGLFAGLLYAVIPHHLTEIFQFFLFAEFAAWGILPYCFLFLTRICRGGTWSDVFLFAVAYSALILTHIPTTIIVSLTFPIYVLFSINLRDFKRTSLHLLVAVALTLLATCYRWVIIVSELDWVAHSGAEYYGSDYYAFTLWMFPNALARHSLFRYVLKAPLFDVAIVLTISLLIPAFVQLKRRSELTSAVRNMFIASLVTALFAFFMISRASFYIWDNITLLQKIQYPWRWMSVLSMFCVVLFSLSLPQLLQRTQGVKRFVIYPALASVVAVIILDIGRSFLSVYPVPGRQLSALLMFGVVLFLLSVPDLMMRFHTFQRSIILPMFAMGITFLMFNINHIFLSEEPVPRAEFTKIEETVKTEPMWKGWWPVWAKEEAFENAERVSAGSRKVEITDWNRETKGFLVKPGEPTNIRVLSFYYPHWTATVNDTQVEVSKDANGVILLPVPFEASTVRLMFQEPWFYIIANWISFLTWMLLAVVMVASIAEKRSRYFVHP